MRILTMKLLGCMLFLFSFTNIKAQDRTVSGKVTSKEGESLPGTSIQVKGATTGTVTDSDGNFSLNVPSDATLVVSFVGYVTQEVKVGASNTINVVMESDMVALSEIVVVGYGTQKKADLTGAVGGIRSSDVDISSKPISSPDQILAGRISGVTISNRSGDPGAPINVRIRGVGTTGVNQPLWVIDGVPLVETTNMTVNTSSTTESNPLAGINPSDIESMDVLKDASAAAIYGARAANGVIIVTTKRGKDGKASVSYDGYTGIGSTQKRMDVLNVDQFIDVQTKLGRDFSQFKGQPTVDWQDAVFRKSSVQSHNISVSGGSANANYFIGAGYIDQQGIERAQGFKRYSIKANSDIKVGKFFKFGESLLLSSVDRLTQSEDGLFAGFNAATNNPFFKIYDPKGPMGYNPENNTTLGMEGYGQNLIMRTDTKVNETKITNRKVLANLYGEFEPLKGLKYRISGGLDYNVGSGDFFQEAISYDNIYTRQSLLVQERPIELTTNFNQTLTYTKSFGSHDVTLMVGEEETNFRFDKMRIQGGNLFNSNIRFASTGTSMGAANEADHWALRGYLGRVNYSYKSKYLLTFNVRNDISSRFAKANRSQTFPSLSLGWRLSDESFFPKNKIFDDVKIRAGWGQSGNQFTGTNFAYMSTLQTTIFYVTGNGQNLVRGPAPIVFANPDLKWETSTQTDIGTDMSMLQGKLELTFDYYKKLSQDVLIGYPMPLTTGFFLPASANIGKIVNKGIELALNYRGSVGEIKYGLGGNITTVHNEVLELGNVPPIITGVMGASTHRTIVGEPLGHFYGFKTNGLYQNQTDVNNALPDSYSAGAQPGDFRFVDVNKDGKIDDGDRTNIGSSIPKFFYGITGSLNYKGIDVSLLLQGVGKVQVYNAARATLENFSGNNNFSTRALQAWNGEGSTNDIPRLARNDPNGNNRFSDRWIENASFMRIKNLQIGYMLPADKLQSLTKGAVSKVRAYVGVQNLKTFTKYLGFDPEVTRGFSFQKGDFPLANGQDSGSSPQPRIFQFGWQVTF